MVGGIFPHFLYDQHTDALCDYQQAKSTYDKFLIRTRTRIRKENIYPMIMAS